MAELARVGEEQTETTKVHLHLLYTQKEEEIAQLQTKMTKMINAKIEYADIFDVDMHQNIDAQINSIQNTIHEFQNELHSITLEYDLHVKETETKRELLESTKNDITTKLTLAETKLAELQEKIKRKKNQLDNNFDKLF
jgi:cytochrome c peroxidase